METIQETLGVSNQTKSKLDKYTNDAKSSSSTKNKKPGIDVVLGSQWGDEGKGKLVDMLSQVCVFMCVLYYVCKVHIRVCDDWACFVVYPNLNHLTKLILDICI